MGQIGKNRKLRREQKNFQKPPKSMWGKTMKKSGNMTRGERRLERLRWLLIKMQPFIDAIRNKDHFVEVPNNKLELQEIIKKYPNDIYHYVIRYTSCCQNSPDLCSRMCKKCIRLIKNDPFLETGDDPYPDPYIEKAQFKKIIFMVSRCFFPPFIDEYNGVDNEELIASYNLQHNLKLILLGEFKCPTIPDSWGTFIDIHNKFVKRQVTVQMSRMCRGLTFYNLHTNVLYEIFKRLLPENMTRNDIVMTIEKVMKNYRSNH